MADTDEHDWPPLTDEDRRKISEIRRRLDHEFGALVDDPAGPPARWRRPLMAAATVAMCCAVVMGNPSHLRDTPPALTSPSPPVMPAAPDRPEHAAVPSRPTVHAALEAWLDATRDRDIPTQMTFYPAVVPVFYTWRNATSASVRAEKQKVLGDAWTLDIRTGPARVEVADDGRSAVTRFRKAYVIEGPRVRRRGEVLQELRWTYTSDGWKITGERDAAVLARH